LASSGRNALTCRYRKPAGVEHQQQAAEAGTEPRLGKASCAVGGGGFGVGGGKLRVGGRYESIAPLGVTESGEDSIAIVGERLEGASLGAIDVGRYASKVEQGSSKFAARRSTDCVAVEQTTYREGEQAKRA
jgi:hypothetical protein